jgi:hypothetical protein
VRWLSSSRDLMVEVTELAKTGWRGEAQGHTIAPGQHIGQAISRTAAHGSNSHHLL